MDQFHASEDLQARCTAVNTNAQQYLTLEHVEGQGQSYKATTLIPSGTLLAAYSGSLERILPGEEDSLNHSMAQGKLDFPYDLRVNGTPSPGDTRPGRLQLVNHGCAPGNNAICEEWHCPVTGLTAYFLRSKEDILPDREVKFPYQEPTFRNGVQVYPANKFWKEAAALPRVRKGWRLVQCNCAGTLGHCPNAYGRHERIHTHPPPHPPPPPPPRPPPQPPPQPPPLPPPPPLISKLPPA